MLCIAASVFLLIFAVLGVVYLINEIIFCATSVKNDKNFLLITGLNDDPENAELLLRSAAARMKWLGRGFSSCIICLDNGMNEETRKICEAVCRENEFMEIKTLSEFEGMI